MILHCSIRRPSQDADKDTGPLVSCCSTCYACAPPAQIITYIIISIIITIIITIIIISSSSSILLLHVLRLCAARIEALPSLRGNHLSNATCITHVFFRNCE